MWSKKSASDSHCVVRECVRVQSEAATKAAAARRIQTQPTANKFYKHTNNNTMMKMETDKIMDETNSNAQAVSVLLLVGYYSVSAI